MHNQHAFRSAASLAAAIVLVIAATSCHTSTEPLLIAADGQIVRGVENCLFIEAGKTMYRPIDLPAEFAVEGLRVHFDAIPRPIENVCMAGESVSLEHIERLP